MIISDDHYWSLCVLQLTTPESRPPESVISSMETCIQWDGGIDASLSSSTSSVYVSNQPGALCSIVLCIITVYLTKAHVDVDVGKQQD